MTLVERIRYFWGRHGNSCNLLLFFIGIMIFPLVQDNPYNLGLTNQIAINVIIVLGLNLFVGYAGQISLGHAGFFALGAYGSAILTVNFGIWPWPAMAITAMLVGLVALAIGIPTLRLSGHYLAMATLGFNIVIYTVLLQWDKVTGGPDGFVGTIEPLSVGTLPIDDEIRFHYLVWGMVFLLVTLCLNLVRSGVGRGLASLAADERAAGALGVNTAQAKVKIFALSAIFASIGGSLYSHCFLFINPDTFSIFHSVDFVIMVVVGGLGSVWGGLFGAGLITYLPELLDAFEAYKDIIHGLILVLILLYFPQGFVAGLVDMWRTKRALKKQLKQLPTNA
ncbi:MAG: branched-chain amino acid ABC transporter permease [Thermodesulfobacteriota bacterium]